MNILMACLIANLPYCKYLIAMEIGIGGSKVDEIYYQSQIKRLHS